MAFIKVKIGSNMNRTEILVDSAKTLREVLEDNDVSYATSTIYVDGVTVPLGGMDKTLDELNLKDGAYIISATKTENAAGKKKAEPVCECEACDAAEPEQLSLFEDELTVPPELNDVPFNAILVQDSIIFRSAITYDELLKIKRFVPEALTLHRDENGKKGAAIFAFGYGDVGSVSENGVIFNSTTDDGNLVVTVNKIEGTDEHMSSDDKYKAVAEQYANVILRAQALEEQIKGNLAAWDERITIAQEAISEIRI